MLVCAIDFLWQSLSIRPELLLSTILITDSKFRIVVSCSTMSLVELTYSCVQVCSDILCF